MLHQGGNKHKLEGLPWRLLKRGNETKTCMPKERTKLKAVCSVKMTRVLQFPVACRGSPVDKVTLEDSPMRREQVTPGWAGQQERPHRKFKPLTTSPRGPWTAAFSLKDIQQAENTEGKVGLEERLAVTRILIKVCGRNKMLDFDGEDCYQGRAWCRN